MKWLFAFLLLWPVILKNNSKKFFIVWNVGQGSWSTVADSKECLHFDMGGEFYPKDVTRLCHKKNILFLSHWDWDHYRFISRFNQESSSLCIYKIPIKLKQKKYPRIKLCSSFFTPDIREIDDKKNYTTSNDSSLVYQYKNFLIPGDSSSKKEKSLINWIEDQDKIHYLLLGHHGSQTSTSNDLLKNLKKLRLAIASQRYKRYGHPHASVLERLKKHKIPLLKTEDWGNIYFELN